MNKSNIWEITNLVDLANILRNNLTVIVGLVLPTDMRQTKIMLRKFLKDKAKTFNLITFIYMEVQPESMGKMGIISNDKDDFPLVYHIRDSKVVVQVKRATMASLVDSFAMAEKYYIQEMNDDKQNADNKQSLDPELEKKKLIDKALKLDQAYTEVQTQLLKEVQRRKQIEAQ